MNCKDVHALFSEYYDSEAFEDDMLPQATRAAIAAHLAACAPCAAAYAGYAALLDEVWNLPDVEIPPGFHQKLMGYVNANFNTNFNTNINRQKQRLQKPLFRHARTWAAMAATLAAVFLWGLFAFSPATGTSPAGNGYIPIAPMNAELLPQGRGIAPVEGFAADIDTPTETTDAEDAQGLNTLFVFAMITSLGAAGLWGAVILLSGKFQKR